MTSSVEIPFENTNIAEYDSKAQVADLPDDSYAIKLIFLTDTFSKRVNP